jgi:MFS family permease
VIDVRDLSSSIAHRKQDWLAHLNFPLFTGVLFAFFLAASAPSPLFVIFQKRWGFSPGMLTVAFSIYALTLLIALLIAGSLSDHVGRRPVIIGALVVQTGAMYCFVRADGIAGLIIARTLQGLGTGIASGALAAAIVEAAAPSAKRFSAVVVSVTPLAGLATGGLLTGIIPSCSSRPEAIVFVFLVGLFPACILPVWASRETAVVRAGALRSLLPKISVAPVARALLASGLPLIMAVWALCGLYLSLVPPILSHVFDMHSGLVNGSVIAVYCGLGAIVPPCLMWMPKRWTALGGSIVLLSGIGLLVIALAFGSLATFVTGTALAGAGAGVAITTFVQQLIPLAEKHEQAGLFAAVYVATYLSLSIPPISAGFLVPVFGYLRTAESYLVGLGVLTAVSIMIQRRMHVLPTRSMRTTIKRSSHESN